MKTIASRKRVGKTGQKNNLPYNPPKWPSDDDGEEPQEDFYIVDINEDVLVDVENNTVGA